MLFATCKLEATLNVPLSIFLWQKWLLLGIVPTFPHLASRAIDPFGLVQLRHQHLMMLLVSTKRAHIVSDDAIDDIAANGW